MADLDDPHRRTNFHQREITDGAPGFVDDRVGVRVARRRAFGDKGGKLLCAFERSVSRYVSPDLGMTLKYFPQIARVGGHQLLDVAIMAFERHRTGKFRRCGVDLCADRLAGLRMAVDAHGFGRFTKSSWKNLLSSAFVTMPAKLSNLPASA